MTANSGFGWDPMTDTPTAPASVWDDVIAVHPGAKEFKTRPLFMYAELDRIFSGSAATGSFAVHTDDGDATRMAPTSLSELSSDSDAGNDEDDAGESKTETDIREEPAPSRRLRRQRREANPRALTPAKRRKTTGEKMSDAMTTMANAQDSIATVMLERHNRGRQLTCSDEAIQIFKEMFKDKVPVEQRFKFVELLATERDAATMFSNMDDESREYMVKKFIEADLED